MKSIIRTIQQVHRNSWKNFFTITIPVCCILLVLLEILFRTLIPASSHPYFGISEQDGFTIGRYNDLNGKTGVRTYGPLGRSPARWRINNHGWNSEVDYRYSRSDSNRQRIAVIGDSYVEAFHVQPDESLTARLRDMFPEADVYSFGIGGAPLSQYLHFARYVRHFYDPDIYIVVVANNDFDQSLVQYGDSRNLLFYTDNGTVGELGPVGIELKHVRLRRRIYKSALVRYLVYNLQADRLFRSARIALAGKRPGADGQTAGSMVADSVQPEIRASVVDPESIASGDSTISLISGYFTDALALTCAGAPVVLINDGQRDAIYGAKRLKTEFRNACKLLEDHARRKGFAYIDMHPVFESDYQSHGRRFNRRTNAHWNAYGHQVVADTLAGTIRLIRAR